MYRWSLLCFLSCFCCLTLLAQDQRNEKTIRINCSNRIDTSQKPLVLINELETDLESVVIDPASIDRIDVLKDRNAVEQYGDKAKAGVIRITMKPGVSFYTLSDYVTSKSNNSVRQIRLNGKTIRDMNRLLIQKNALVSTMIESKTRLEPDNCILQLDDMLVITTRFPNQK
jgi:hypothetical protein